MTNKFFLSLLFSFLFILLFCYSQAQNDSIDSKITVTFNKVKPSFKEANKVSLISIYLPKSDSFLVKFEVPSFNYRHNTSLEDYCIISAGGNNIKALNTVVNPAKKLENNSIITTYTFSLVLSRESFSKMLSSNFKNINFYFTPNKNIEVYINNNKYLNDSFDKHQIKLSKKIIKYKVSKPDKEQYKQLSNWLEKLDK